MVETALVSILSGIPALQAVVATRIYPAAAPEGSLLPNLTYQLITGKSIRSLQGVSNLRQAIFQVSVWSQLESEVKAAADAIYEYFRGGYAGLLGGFAIQWIEAEEESDDYANLASQATESGIYRSITHLTIWYSPGS